MTQCSPIAFNAAASVSTRRGLCPALDAPMQTGDGLLVRLRPLGNALSPRDFITIAESAARHGNGLLEVTARGNVQIRGLTPASAPLLSADILAMDMDLSTGLAIETPPLAGLDASEIADARPLAAALRAAVGAEEPPLSLAAKLAVIVDGGGRFSLAEVSADIRLDAVRGDDDGAVLWRIALAGDGRTARPVALVSGDAAVDAVMSLLRALSAAGKARGRDLDVTAWRSHFGCEAPGDFVPAPVPPVAGVHRLAGGDVLGVVLPFCQIDSASLIAFLRAAEGLGAAAIRLAPGHGFFLVGLAPDRIEAARDIALFHGLIVAPGDPAHAIALCAGSRGCASAFFDTHALARVLIDTAGNLLDGSLRVHLSGCAKGCAHPAPAGLTLTAAPSGYGLVVNGAASGSPEAYIAAKDIAHAIARLSALVGTARGGKETAADCLTRLGVDAIRDAVRQGRE